jgi:hypothetical protein
MLHDTPRSAGLLQQYLPLADLGSLIARGQVIFIPEIARSATVLHQPLIEPNDVKWRLAGQRAATVLNGAAQAEIVRASALCRVVR